MTFLVSNVYTIHPFTNAFSQDIIHINTYTCKHFVYISESEWVEIILSLNHEHAKFNYYY